MQNSAKDLKKFIRDIPDFPAKGIIFRDITPLLSNHQAFCKAVDLLCESVKNQKIDYVVAIEARGFIFGSIIADKLGAGFIPIRKKGKLPHKTETITYDLEYGQDTLEVHTDAIEKGASVLMVDDLLATGGTMQSACKLLEKIGGKIIAVNFLIDLTQLNGREKLFNYKVNTSICY